MRIKQPDREKKSCFFYVTTLYVVYMNIIRVLEFDARGI